MHPKQVWPGQAVSLPQAQGSPGLLSSRRTGGSCITWCQRAALPTQASSPSHQLTHQPREPRAGREAPGKPRQGEDCVSTFSKSWEPLTHRSADKEAPWELEARMWVHTAVPQPPCCPAEPPPAFLPGSPFPGATAAFLENKWRYSPPDRVRVMHLNELYLNQCVLMSPAQSCVGTRRQQPELENALE